jgi:hypothetical protein
LRRGQRPILLGRDRRVAEELRLEVVIGQELVDAPDRQPAEVRRKQVRMDVDDRGGAEDVVDGRLHVAGMEDGIRHGDIVDVVH